jgi:ribosomal protein S18 acetylase RimI-like enzyme
LNEVEFLDVRILKAQDAEDYRNLRLEALHTNPEAFSSSYEEEKENSSEFYANRLQSDLAFHFGAFENEKLSGIVTLVKENKLKLRHRASIFAMYVTPDQRGSGIGKRLMEEAVNTATNLAGIEQIYLSVVATNESAKRLYTALGFHTFGIDKKALKIGETYYDDEHMVLFL